MKLFRSHRPDYKDGEQLRDFVYVKDVVEVCYFFLHHRKDSGLYNLGSGKARTFFSLAQNTFSALAASPRLNSSIRLRTSEKNINTLQRLTCRKLS